MPADFHPLESRRLFAAGIPSFAFPIGGTGHQVVTAQVTDPAGNLYVAGTFDGGAVDFNPSPRKTFALTPGPNGSAFVAKYSPAGGLYWAHKVDASVGGELTYRSLTIDPLWGDLLLGGSFRGSVMFDFKTFQSGFNSTDGSVDSIWLRADAVTGDWKRLGRPSNNVDDDFIDRVATDAAGHVYLAGQVRYLSSTPNAGTPVDTGFLWKYTAKSRPLWVQQWSSDTGDATVTALAVDAAGNATVAGVTDGRTDFDQQVPLHGDTVAGPAAYLAQFAPDGTIRWAGGLASDVSPPVVNDLAVDSAGNIYAGGEFAGLVDFNVSPRKAYAYRASDGSAGFVAKYSPAGGLYYAKFIGLEADANSSRDAVTSVAVDPATGEVYAAGTFAGLTMFNPNVSGFRFRPAAGSDGFIAKYAAAGDFVTAWQFAGPADDAIARISVGPTHSLFASGPLAGTLDVNPGAGVLALAPRDADDAFVVRLT